MFSHRVTLAFDRCQEFAEQECKVYATSEKPGMIEDFKSERVESRIATRVMDVKRDEDVKRVVAEILDTEGKIDIVVNNAGIHFFCE